MRLSLALTRRGLALVGSAALLWVLWMFLGLRDIWYLVAFFAALPILALLWTLLIPAMSRLSVRVDSAAFEPTVGDHVWFTFTASQKLRTTLPISFDWDVSGNRHPAEISVPSHRAIATRVRVYMGKRGPFEVKVDNLRVSDPLGLAVRRIGKMASAEVLVLPRPLSDLRIPVPATNQRPSVSMLSSNSIGEMQGTPAGSVREYRVGDAMRQVHWKQSARQGQLLVNQYEPEKGHDRTLLFVTDRSSYSSVRPFEAAVSATAAIAIKWLGPNRPVVLHLGSSEPIECRTVEQILHNLALVEFTSTDIPVPRPLDGVVIGVLTPNLEAALQNGKFRGVLWAVRGSEIGAPWQQELIPVGAPGTPAPGTDNG